jgi:hypothetical protein
VSLKHNSKFASFTLLAKGDYSYELHIPLPFSLVINDVSHNQLTVMPAYWFLYNLYALTRNAHKYIDRDKRTNKVQQIEYDFLAPDSVNEIFTALDLLKKFTALSQEKNVSADTPEAGLLQAGTSILEDPGTTVGSLSLTTSGFENSSRPVCIAKVGEAYRVYKNAVIYYGVRQLIDHITTHGIPSFPALMGHLPSHPKRLEWVNVGGQLIASTSLQLLLKNIKDHSIRDWEQVHEFYEQNSRLYLRQKLEHAYASLLEIVKVDQLDLPQFRKLLRQALEIKGWMVDSIYSSRARDYQSEFRKMIYDNEAEMDSVIGKLEDNSFIEQQQKELAQFRSEVEEILRTF